LPDQLLADPFCLYTDPTERFCMADSQQPNDSNARPAAAGPLNLEAIRQARLAQEQASEQSQPPKRQKRAPGNAEGQESTGGVPVDAAQSADPAVAQTAPPQSRGGANNGSTRGGQKGEKIDAEAMPARYRSNKDSAPAVAPKVPVPNARRRDQIEDSELAEALDLSLRHI
jgi:hypothetical protein